MKSVLAKMIALGIDSLPSNFSQDGCTDLRSAKRNVATVVKGRSFSISKPRHLSHAAVETREQRHLPWDWELPKPVPALHPSGQRSASVMGIANGVSTSQPSPPPGCRAAVSSEQYRHVTHSSRSSEKADGSDTAQRRYRQPLDRRAGLSSGRAYPSRQHNPRRCHRP
jgi:hypothetical protein